MSAERLYFLGIGGTLMGSLALLAKEMGCAVSGFDRALYPPMSDLLADAGIEVFEGFEPSQLNPPPDLAVIGNAQLPRGHPAVEAVLESNIPYTSGAEWLGNAVLHGRWTIAVAGTHGKTTTASMIAHILDSSGLEPGFLIGGSPGNFGVSARLGSGPYFVVEADEYDTSYFDRRSKFVHYRPRTLVIGNLEHDHADIFADIGQILTQFHHLLRTVPASGLVIAPVADAHVDKLLDMGCWTPVARFAAGSAPPTSGDRWQATDVASDGATFTVTLNGRPIGTVSWPMLGTHNVANALAAVAAARHAGVPPTVASSTLATFKAPKRRMELIAVRRGLRVYDDFAHHPTAIRTTLKGLRAHVGSERIVAVIEPGTHTMSLGTFRDALATCCVDADQAIWFRGEYIRWDVSEVVRASPVPAMVETDIDRLAETIAAHEDDRPCHVVLMSNGSFGGIYAKLRQRLS